MSITKDAIREMRLEDLKLDADKFTYLYDEEETHPRRLERILHDLIRIIAEQEERIKELEEAKS